MEFKLEVVVVPVTDVDRAKAFYADTLGFNVDVDSSPSPDFRVVQLTPPGSGCSVTIGKGIARMEPGSLKGLQLCVGDIEAAPGTHRPPADAVERLCGFWPRKKEARHLISH